MISMHLQEEPSLNQDDLPPEFTDATPPSYELLAMLHKSLAHEDDDTSDIDKILSISQFITKHTLFCYLPS